MGAGFSRTLGFSAIRTKKFRNCHVLPKNIKDFDRTYETMIILLTDDKLIERGNKIIFDT